ncbi:hypothetical protein GN958_ATG21412 [Phytophthora infestans]|uniref:Uncharacterized protein n=1 Tax=Phytophthora infestans TaxID=4787 RepID=A0A8S9TRA5_PHYIN|nr:hypothetical protein GN958_ATG21412 [Phytophthora infestans]
MAVEIAVSGNILLNTQYNTVEKTAAVSTVNTNALQHTILALIQFSTSAYANPSTIHLPTQCREPPVLELQLEQPSPTETELAPIVLVRRSSRVKRLPQRSLPAYSARPEQSTKRRKAKKSDQAPGKWQVAFIKDRVTTSTGQILYHVLWESKKHGRLPRPWEPRDMLLHDGFGEELTLVDEWVDGGRKQDFFFNLFRNYIPALPVQILLELACSLHFNMHFDWLVNHLKFKACAFKNLFLYRMNFSRICHVEYRGAYFVHLFYKCI